MRKPTYPEIEAALRLPDDLPGVARLRGEMLATIADVELQAIRTTGSLVPTRRHRNVSARIFADLTDGIYEADYARYTTTAASFRTQIYYLRKEGHRIVCERGHYRLV